MSEGPTLVDARGLSCPWPALRLARAARQLGGKGTIKILADDPVAPAELAQLCAERGWTFASDEGTHSCFNVILT